MSLTDIPGRAASGRASTVEAFSQMMPHFFPRELVAEGLNRTLRPTDIVVTPFAKSGTTWLQQIAHSLRTRGDEDFDDISRVTPWFEAGVALGIDLDAEQVANPRVFKSHMDAHRVPKGGRYINSCRHPHDAAWSAYKFMDGWFLEPGAVDADEFVLQVFVQHGMAGADYWDHLSSWWERRNDPDVLFLAYEHMKEDLPGTIRKVSAFMDIELDEELLAITEERASLTYMKAHKDKFDDLMMRELGHRNLGVPLDSDSAKVRTGQVGESKKGLSDAVRARLDEIWAENITKPLGFGDYESMIATLK